MKPLNILFFLVILTGCSLDTSKQNIAELEWLVGDWVDEEHDYYESWTTAGDALMGTGLTITEGDTVFSEVLRIADDEGVLTYYAVVSDQNDGKEVPFKLMHSDTAWVFSNAGHDFPNRIIYTKQNSGQMTVRVENSDRTLGFILQLKRRP